jgi:hypothetical protein
VEAEYASDNKISMQNNQEIQFKSVCWHTAKNERNTQNYTQLTNEKIAKK